MVLRGPLGRSAAAAKASLTRPALLRDGMTRTGARAPESIQKHFENVEFPTDRDHLLQAARMNGADPETVEEIRRLPDLRFDTPTDVVAAYQRLR